MTDDHEHYRELCAEDAAGHLSESDWADLQAHRNACRECQELSRDLLHLSIDIMPKVADLCGERRIPNPERKNRVLQLAAADGLTIAPEQPRQLKLGRPGFVRASLYLAWLVSMIVAVLVTGIILKHTRTSNRANVEKHLPAPNSTDETKKLKVQLERALADEAADRSTSLVTNEEIARLRRTLEQQKRTNAERQSVRELLGDRKLHLFNIFPLDTNGKPTGEFGRLFFIEGKRLEFYAFDLKNPKTVNPRDDFYIWGETRKAGESATQAFLLGKLKLDSVKDNRWSLVVSDPRVLNRLRSVFVTVESSEHEITGPTGRRMLFVPLENRPDYP